MVFWRVWRPALAGALFLGLGGQAAPAQRGDTRLALLNQLERGQWQLRERDGTLSKLCLGNPSVLIQLQHGKTQCEHFVMSSDSRSATVRYTCPGHGHGRTVISVETARLVKIETQGVVDGAPFEREYEARKIGACG